MYIYAFYMLLLHVIHLNSVHIVFILYMYFFNFHAKKYTLIIIIIYY